MVLFNITITVFQLFRKMIIAFRLKNCQQPVLKDSKD
jgi:hypothetical protein